MIFRRAVAVNWNAINIEPCKLLVASNNNENKSCLPKHYAVRDKILVVLDANECRSNPKMEAPKRRPFTITMVHNNGTVEISVGRTIETINICRIKPYISK
jgi:hypothetical protein